MGTNKPGSGRPPGRSGGAGTGPRGGASTGGRGKGTNHGGRGKSGAGAGQTRPPEKSCGKSMIAVPVTIVKLLFGWRPAGYQVADVPWPWQSA